MFARYASAVSSGIFATVSLLFVMQALINNPAGSEVEPRDRMVLNWIDKITETPIQKKEYKVTPEDLTKQHPEPKRPQHGPDFDPIKVPRNVVNAPNTKLQPMGTTITDGPLVSVVRVQPVYPSAGIARGLEGYVIVQFDVGANGLVSNVVVIESSNAIFNKAAIKAAERFKFKPRVVDGVALPTRDIQNLFRFELDN